MEYAGYLNKQLDYDKYICEKNMINVLVRCPEAIGRASKPHLIESLKAFYKSVIKYLKNDFHTVGWRGKRESFPGWENNMYNDLGMRERLLNLRK